MRMRKFKLLLRTKSQVQYATTHECFGFILMLGKCFAMFPLEGLMKSDFRALRFRWLSWSTSYTFLFLLGISFMLSFHIHNIVQLSELKFGYFVTLLFYTVSFTTTLLFVKLARQWPRLMQKWAEIDYRMGSYGFCKTLPTRLKIISMVVLLAALIEHALYLASAISNITEPKGWEKVRLFLKGNFGHVFTYLSFAVWKGVLLLIVNIMCTFSWNYMDLIIMLISTALAVKFNQITHRLRHAITSKIRYVNFWKELRSDYNALASLCNIVDNAMSDVILLSFANNLFVILVQLFNSLKPRNDNAIGRIYFMYSFTFLVLRTVAVSLYAASINEASKKPTALLLGVSPEVYNVEIERFLSKIQTDPCALTGKKFFKVTKSLILNIAGAIVTYELVLIQFHVVT